MDVYGIRCITGKGINSINVDNDNEYLIHALFDFVHAPIGILNKYIMHMTKRRNEQGEPFLEVELNRKGIEEALNMGLTKRLKYRISELPTKISLEELREQNIHPTYSLETIANTPLPLTPGWQH